MLKTAFLKILTLLSIVLIASGCLDSAARKGRPYITSSSTTGDTTPPTTDTNNTGQRIKDGLILQADFCACSSGKPTISNNCIQACSESTTSGSSTNVLTVNTLFSPEIQLNSNITDLNDWCNKELGDGVVAPNCKLQVTSIQPASTQLLSINDLTAGSAQFTVNLTPLSQHVVYKVSLKEVVSGIESTYIQFDIRDIETTTQPVNGLIDIMPISQYGCLTRKGSTENNSNTYNNFARYHYYYKYNNKPDPLTDDNQFLICHDEQDSKVDTVELPRLNLVPHFFSLWSLNDDLFFNDSTGKKKILTELEKRSKILNNNNTVTVPSNLFGEFSWETSPGSGAKKLGYYMVSWHDDSAGRSFCPNNENYNSGDVLFRAMKDYLPETEGAYFAQAKAESITIGSTSIAQDTIVIREGILKQIWFYKKDNLNIKPDDITSKSETTYFYWPPHECVYNESCDNKNDFYPYLRRPEQRTYTVRSQSDLSNTTSGTGGNIEPDKPSSDKRFGCIPKLQITTTD